MATRSSSLAQTWCIALLGFTLVPGVSAGAFCYEDIYGVERCRLTGWLGVGVGLGITALSIALVVGITICRRRRAQKANAAFVAQNVPNVNRTPYAPLQPQQEYPVQNYPPPGYAQQQYGPQGPQGYAPGGQYPPQTYNAGGYGPPPGPPPPVQQYDPPKP
ncbi:hypothetical protein BD410DRAFT_794701 [Rickenella mellea]|uniref:Transmembrane protein n=1 Tax=Rickenella mellea TaxID=50990 RepID=A0A4Y7PPJ2_9AGAM|nr:hypothetical protein BD410DRAFT_794701 [Rickenella mellea]